MCVCPKTMFILRKIFVGVGAVYLLPACREYPEGDIVANSGKIFKWRQNALAECMEP